MKNRSITVSLLRIPTKLDSDSEPSWTRIPEQAGQSERSDAGFGVFTLRMLSGSSFLLLTVNADGVLPAVQIRRNLVA
jgi:hypothetical protein